MTPAAALACALCLAAPLSAQPGADSVSQDGSTGGAAKAPEHPPGAGAAPEAIGPAQASKEADGGVKEKTDKLEEKLKDLEDSDGEKALQKAQAAPEAESGLSEASLKAAPVADSPGKVEQAKTDAKRQAVPGAPEAPGAAGGRSAAAKQAVSKQAVAKHPVADASRVPSTAAGRKTMKLMSRWGGALGTEYKTTESGPALPSEKPLDKPVDQPSGRPSDKVAAAPLKPRALDELSLAALSGRSRALDAMGLKIQPGADGRPRVLRSDGTPATPQQAEAAVRALAQEPAALVRRPDFFQTLPREHYEALRAAYAPASPQFRDIGLRAQRDFQWTRTCSGVSGGCNPYSAESHYERGRDVSPETLETIYRRAEAPKPGAAEPSKDDAAEPSKHDAAEDEPARDLGEADADDERLVEAARAAEGVGERRGVLGDAAARLKSLLSGIKPGGAGSWNGGARSEAGGPGVSSTGGAARAGAPAAGPAASIGVTPGAGASDALPGSGASAVNDAAPRRSWRGAGLLGLAAAALAAAAILRRF